MAYLTITLPHKLVEAIVNNLGVTNFVETGTFHGETARWASGIFDKVYTIEIAPTIVPIAAKNLQDCPNVTLIEGDSRDELPKLISSVNTRTLFFLDAYWSDGKGGKENECPLLDELKAISSAKDPIIFINDIRNYLGPRPHPHKVLDWPTFEEVFALCKQLFPASRVTIVDGNIAVIPKDVENLVDVYWVETEKHRNYVEDPKPENLPLHKRLVRKIKFEKQKRKERGENDSFVLQLKNNGWFEAQKAEFCHYHRWLQSEGFKSIIDVGANVGQFGKKIRGLYPDAQIYSFEPIPFVYSELMKNFEGDTHFKAFNVGLGDKLGEMEFFLNEFSDSSSMLKMGDLHKENFPYTKKERVIKVDIKLLDECIDVNTIQKPYLLKLDVQGFEKQVLDGGMEIARNAEMIITEASYKELYENQLLFDQMYDLITAMGFRYIGNLEQMNSAFTGEPLQGDAIFKKIK